MMDTAYFVGRGELIDFFNGLLDLQLTKIEQTASGAIACQLTEYIFPGEPCYSWIAHQFGMGTHIITFAAEVRF